MEGIKLKARAKINLSLDIIGRAANGYHLLDSVMHSIELHDTVTVQPDSSGLITVFCDSPAAPEGERNIAYTAAKSFFEAAGILNSGVHIEIEKRIPSPGGLGGGSADAAAVLNGLNFIHNRPLCYDELIALALSVGSDVPFCIEGGCQRVMGIGERLSPADPITFGYVLLVKAGEKIGTKEMYSEYDKMGAFNAHHTDDMISALERGDIGVIGSTLSNAFDMFYQGDTALTVKKVLLRHGACGVSITGSGPYMFGLFASESEAKTAKSELIHSEFEVICCEI